MKSRHPFSVSFLSMILVLFLLGSFVKGGQAMSTEEEKKLGKKAIEEIRKQLEVVNELSLQAFINRVGHFLVNQVGPTPFDFDFHVIKAVDPNAFAVPGGHIYVTTGLLSLVENEPEFAGVLAHEISHVTGRHIARMIEKTKGLNIVTLAAMIAGAIAGRGGPASGAAMSMGMATQASMMLKYTREIETEADHNAIHLMTNAGYDPQAMVSFMKRIERYSLANAPNIPSYLLSHPTTESRVTLLENILTIEPKPAHFFYGAGNYKRIQMRAFIEESDPSSAVSHFESILKAHPDDFEALIALGLAFQKAGRSDRSAEVLQTVSIVYPMDPDLQRELGVAYFFAGKLDQAIQTLEPLSQDNDLKSLYFLGRAYQEKGDTDRALGFFLRVRREMGDFVDVYFNLGSVYGRLGQKGLSHFAFGKYFELRGERNTALLHYRTALDLLEKGTSEREETQKMLRELAQTK